MIYKIKFNGFGTRFKDNDDGVLLRRSIISILNKKTKGDTRTNLFYIFQISQSRGGKLLLDSRKQEKTHRTIKKYIEKMIKYNLITLEK